MKDIDFNCVACGEPNTFDEPDDELAGSYLAAEQCVRCRSWNLAVGQQPEGTLLSEVALFPADQPPEWKDGEADVCGACKGIVPEGVACIKCGK